MTAARVKALRIVVGVLIALILGCLALPAMQKITWVGFTDLQIIFVVSDHDTGMPISNASIHVHQYEGSLCEDKSEKEFDLVTDQNGTVEQLCKQCMCFGTKGLITDTFATHVPHWKLNCSAPGYKSEEFWLRDHEGWQNAHRANSHAAMTIRIQLWKDKQ